MAPDKQQKLEDVAGIKRQREGEEADPTEGQDNGKTNDTDGGKQGAPAEEPEPKHLKISHAPASVLEEGRIYFYYRPRVGLAEAHKLSDVQRFFVVLSPESREGAPRRMIAIGKKRMPDAATRERFFGFVQATAGTMEELTKGLGPQDYETKTQGHRHVEPARALGEGVYAITDAGRDSHLVYELEVPEQPGEVQDDFKLGKTGKYVLSIKNPDISSPPNAGLNKSQKADFPEEKKKEFEGTPGGYSWISAKDTSLLDYEGCEMVLIGVKGEIEGEVKQHLDAEVAAEVEQAEHEYKGGAEDDSLLEKLRAEIKAEAVPTDPAATGEWK